MATRIVRMARKKERNEKRNATRSQHRWVTGRTSNRQTPWDRHTNVNGVGSGQTVKLIRVARIRSLYIRGARLFPQVGIIISLFLHLRHSALNWTPSVAVELQLPRLIPKLPLSPFFLFTAQACKIRCQGSYPHPFAAHHGNALFKTTNASRHHVT